MRVYRLTRAKYARLLNGAGAALYNNRWNSKGTSMVYTSESRALAMAEVAVHLPLTQLPGDFEMIELEIPVAIQVPTVSPDSLPSGWNRLPYSVATQQLGDEFVEAKQHLAIRVPSAVVYGDFNVLLNPEHPAMKKIRIVSSLPFIPDHRLYG